LTLDKRCNEPLNSILNVLDIFEEEDRVAVFYNFKPVSQRRWSNQWNATYKRFNNNEPLDKEVLGRKYIIKLLALTFIEVLEGIFEAVGEVFKKDKKSVSFVELAITNLIGNNKKELSPATIKKKDSIILNTQIAVISESKDKNRMVNNANAVAQAFYQLNEDNELSYSELSTKRIYYTNYSIGTVNNKMSIDECQNLLELPGRTLLERHKAINKVDVLETPVPDELRHGYLNLGNSIYRGNEQPAYLRDEYDQGNLPLTVMGPQGSGKSTFFANYAKFAHSRNEAVIVIDFIKNCELSEAIKSVIPEEDLLELNLGNSKDLQGFGYNEIKFNSDMDDFEILELANLQAQQTMALIDAINNEGLPLTSKMRRYLSSAANVVFLNEGASIRDVVNCLQDYRKRSEFIKKVPESLKEQLEDEINALTELDDITIYKDKDTKDVVQEVTGTKDSKIDGILDRVNLLKEDAKLKYMFNKRLDINIDLVEEIEKGKVILIKMPEVKFPLQYVKNVLVTYFNTKIWLAAQIRGSMYDKPKRFHIIEDEIYQAKTTERILKDILPQTRKVGSKFVFSCHYLSQIETIQEALKASGSSYMLLQGTDKKNYEELKEELKPYELEDLLNLKQYHSLNLIKYEKGYAKFITHLPLPVNK
jgi:shikimate kinase